MYDPSDEKIDAFIGVFSRVLKLALKDNPLDDSGISTPQLALLDWLAAQPGSGVREIADGLNLTSPTVSVSVRRLEDAGLLNRQPHPNDGRAIQFALSEKGTRLHTYAVEYRRTKIRQLISHLTQDESDALLALMCKATIDASEDGCS